jgi:hypothetical protein
MTALTVRRLLIDLDGPVARHWCGGDAFRSAFFAALSMSFPVGEQFFIDAIRQGLQALPPSTQERFRDEVQGFIGQEATHRRIHGLFNARLAEHGLTNHWETRARLRLQLLEGQNPRHALAITAANEHFTALFAEWMLAHPEWLTGSEPRLQMLWLWHAAEEAEHKCTAFDLYRALGGNEHWRRIWMRRVTVIFLTDALRQTLSNLRNDGTLWQLSTWRSAAAFLFGRAGLLRFSYRPWRAWFRTDFHPGQQHSERSAQWLANNRETWQPVGTQR